MLEQDVLDRRRALARHVQEGEGGGPHDGAADDEQGEKVKPVDEGPAHRFGELSGAPGGRSFPIRFTPTPTRARMGANRI